MTGPTWTQTYDVNTIVLDHQKRLSLVGLLNLLQDTAWIHADHLGWGYEALIEKGTIWVLSRQKLVMTDWPVWEDKVTINTWPRRSGSVIALREFEILANGKKVGECSTSWLVLDWTTRKLQKLDRIMFGMETRSEGVLDIAAERIPSRNDVKTVTTFQVRNSDLDVNAHVNNTRYAQWITDTMTAGELAKYWVQEYEINFLAETGVGDAVDIDAVDIATGADGRVVRQYQGRRSGEDKPAFTARVVLLPRSPNETVAA
jgi:medium-chain acyl-[acyl-carrier-protein] hydrolase